MEGGCVLLLLLELLLFLLELLRRLCSLFCFDDLTPASSVAALVSKKLAQPRTYVARHVTM